jgi:chromatin remodeling complex protein RSC6
VRDTDRYPKLKAVFAGKKQVSMFEMTALVSKHLS